MNDQRANDAKTVEARFGPSPPDRLRTTCMSSVNRKMAQGMLWQTGARLAVRGIGLVSTFILARLLTPADFGLVAIAVTAVALLEVFAEFGSQQRL